MLPRRLAPSAVERLEPRQLLSAADLDPTFGDGGLLQPDWSGTPEEMLVQPDGRIVVAGYDVTANGRLYAAVRRFNPDGSVDTGFGANGVARLGEAYTVFVDAALGPDGDLIAGGIDGSGQWVLARFNADGTPDKAFGGGDGIAKGDGSITALDWRGGRLVTAGGGAVRRHRADGSLDPSFGDGDGTAGVGYEIDGPFAGLRSFRFEELVVRPDGRVVAAGAAGRDWNAPGRAVVVGLTAAGAIDPSFAIDGGYAWRSSYRDERFADLALTPTGETYLLAVDEYHENGVVVRLNADGSFDAGFHAGDPARPGVPIGIDSRSRGVTALPDGKVLVATSTFSGTWEYGAEDLGVVRLNADGTFDASFSGDGWAGIDAGTDAEFATRVAVGPDGSVYVVGESDALPTVTLARINPAPQTLEDLATLRDGVLTLRGTGGRDWLDVMAAGDMIWVGREDEFLEFPLADVRSIRAELGAGNDSLSVDVHVPVWVDAGDGDDYVWTRAGDVTLRGGGGDDELFGGDGRDLLDGGAGDDTLYGNAGNDTLVGGDGYDFLSGNSGKDSIYGGAGKDRLNGHGGHDRLWGQEDADRLYGYDGNDLLDGGASNDRHYGGAGADVFYGQGGNDFFSADDGLAESLFGASGKDRADADDEDLLASVEALIE